VYSATLAVASVDDVSGDAAVRFKIVSIANRVSMHDAAQFVAVLRLYPAREQP